MFGLDGLGKLSKGGHSRRLRQDAEGELEQPVSVRYAEIEAGVEAEMEAVGAEAEAPGTGLMLPHSLEDWTGAAAPGRGNATVAERSLAERLPADQVTLQPRKQCTS